MRLDYSENAGVECFGKSYHTIPDLKWPENVVFSAAVFCALAAERMIRIV